MIDTAPTGPDHPEAAGKPLIGLAVQSILVSQFRDELSYGTQDYINGTHASYRQDAETAILRGKAAKQAGQLSWADLTLCSVFEALSASDDATLRMALVVLGRNTVQWIEALDRKHGVV